MADHNHFCNRRMDSSEVTGVMDGASVVLFFPGGRSETQKICQLQGSSSNLHQINTSTSRAPHMLSTRASDLGVLDRNPSSVIHGHVTLNVSLILFEALFPTFVTEMIEVSLQRVVGVRSRRACSAQSPTLSGGSIGGSATQKRTHSLPVSLVREASWLLCQAPRAGHRRKQSVGASHVSPPYCASVPALSHRTLVI